MKRYQRALPFALLSGAGLLLFALTIFPLIYSFLLSLHIWNITRPQRWNFVGLLNYWEVIKDPVFWRVMLNTAIFTSVAVSIELAIGMGLAHLFNREFRGESYIRSAIVLPMMIPSILVGLIWLFMYKRDFGIINYLLSLLRIEPIAWLSLPLNSLPAVILADIWQWTPFMFLLLLAGLRSLSVELYESVRIDGATAWQTFRYLTVPLLKQIIAIALMIRFMDAFRVFDTIFQLTGGGPGIATETISLYLYRNGFRYFKMGFASALSYIALIIIIVCSSLYLKILEKSGE
jgi:multiple sugar transport system permease protein